MVSASVNHLCRGVPIRNFMSYVALPACSLREVDGQLSSGHGSMEATGFRLGRRHTDEEGDHHEYQRGNLGGQAAVENIGIWISIRSHG